MIAMREEQQQELVQLGDAQKKAITALKDELMQKYQQEKDNAQRLMKEKENMQVELAEAVNNAG